MAGNEDDKDKALAEKAYAAAASSASDKDKAPAIEVKPASEAPKPEEAKPQTPVVKAQAVEAGKTVEAKPAAAAKVAGQGPKAKAVPAAKTPAKPKPAKPKPAKPKVAKVVAKGAPVAVPKPVAKPPVAPVAVAVPKPAPVAPAAAAVPKPAPVAPVAVSSAKPAVAAQPAPTAPGPDAPNSKAAPKTADIKPPLFAGLFNNFLLEEKTMDMSANFNGIQDAVTEVQAKAKAAFEKSTAVLGEISDFTKGNVEAVMESGKILADGIQGFGSELVAEGRSTFETITGDIKELAAAKSPTDFFKIQGDMVRKNFDSAVAYGSKNSEAMLKLVSDAMAPISGRISLAVEKVRQPTL